MKTKLYKIYKLTNLLNGMSYIGYTHKKLIKRIKRHVIAKSYIGNALRNYEVKNFKVEVLHKARDKNLALLLERMEIWNHNCIRPNGYNIMSGGEGGDSISHNPNKEKIAKNQSKKMQGKHHTEEAKIKVKESLIGNQRAKGKNLGNQAVKGKHWNWSEESKEKVKGNQNAKGKHWKWSKRSKINGQIGQLKRRIKESEQE